MIWASTPCSQSYLLKDVSFLSDIWSHFSLASFAIFHNHSSWGTIFLTGVSDPLLQLYISHHHQKFILTNCHFLLNNIIFDIHNKYKPVLQT